MSSASEQYFDDILTDMRVLRLFMMRLLFQF
jgi:hypothetical protein